MDCVLSGIAVGVDLLQGYFQFQGTLFLSVMYLDEMQHLILTEYM